MINFNDCTAGLRIGIYAQEKSIEILESTSRFARIQLDACQSLCLTAAFISGAAEAFFKGTCNLFASPFSKEFSAKTGLRMYLDGIKHTLIFIIFTPSIPFLITHSYISTHRTKEAELQGCHETLAELRKDLQTIEAEATPTNSVTETT